MITTGGQSPPFRVATRRCRLGREGYNRKKRWKLSMMFLQAS
jgi:hypothetical protein